VIVLESKLGQPSPGASSAFLVLVGKPKHERQIQIPLASIPRSRAGTSRVDLAGGKYIGHDNNMLVVAIRDRISSTFLVPLRWVGMEVSHQAAHPMDTAGGSVN
jgi:hypothetical protein